MIASDPVTVACLYRVKQGKEEAFRALLEKHWPTLHEAGLASPEPARWYRGKNNDGKTCFVELLQWKDAEAPGIAHQLPEVMAVWEPMGALVDHMEFIDLEHVESFAQGL